MVFYTLGVQRPLIQAGLLEKKNIIVFNRDLFHQQLFQGDHYFNGRLDLQGI